MKHRFPRNLPKLMQLWHYNQAKNNPLERAHDGTQIVSPPALVPVWYKEIWRVCSFYCQILV